jgi:hypothetical protein
LDRKISFAVDNIALIDEKNDSQFATISIDAFASGDNKHNLIVSEETLRKTAPSIYDKPLVWIYDERFDDIGSHDPYEVPCGFVPSDQEIQFKKLDDGRTMINVVGKIWKRYSGKLLSFFERDDGNKPVSVEMEVFDIKEDQSGKELLDFCFSAITFLGSLVAPAIPGAQGTIISFAEQERIDYEHALLSEFAFQYDDIDLTIPGGVKKNAQIGLDLVEKHQRGGTATAISIAKHLLKNKTTLKKVQTIYGYFNKHKGDNLIENPPSNEYISWHLYGGSSCWKWVQQIIAMVEEIDRKQLSYFGEFIGFPYKSLDDLNPALKSIRPPLTLAQANAIARQADAIGVDKDKNGWATAISNFKKTHTVKDDRWVKKENPNKEEKDMTMDKNPKDNLTQQVPESDSEDFETEEMSEEPNMSEPEEQDMATEEPEEQDMATENEDGDDDKEEEEEESEESDVTMSLDTNIDFQAMVSMLDVESDFYPRVVAECEKSEQERDMALVTYAMFATLQQYTAKLNTINAQLETANSQIEILSAENEDLKQYKQDVEDRKFNFEVDAELEEVKDFVPAKVINELREQSKEYNLSNLDGWKNIVHAKAFSYVKDDKSKDTTVLRFDLPFEKITQNIDKLWK